MCKKGPKGHYLSAEHFCPGMEERKNFNCLLTNKNQTVKKILKKTLLIWLSKGRSVIWQYSIWSMLPCSHSDMRTWILTEKNKYSVACFIDVVWSGLDWSVVVVKTTTCIQAFWWWYNNTYACWDFTPEGFTDWLWWPQQLWLWWEYKTLDLEDFLISIWILLRGRCRRHSITHEILWNMVFIICAHACPR